MRSETEFINETRGAREERLYITATVMKFLNLSLSVPKRSLNRISNETARNFLNMNQIKSPAEILKNVAASYSVEQAEGTENDDCEIDSTPIFQFQPNSQNPSGALNEKQQQVFDTFNNLFAAINVSKITGTPLPQPVRLLVTGGAGVGKSYLTHKIFEKAKEYGLHVGCCACMGKAAILMPEGRTIHNFLGLKCHKKDNLLYNWENVPNAQSIGKTSTHFKRDQIALVIIDEISMLTPNFLAIIDQKLRILTGNHNELFGNLSVMLSGDFFQIPPVKGKSLFSSVLNLNLEQQNSNPEIHGS